MSNGKTVEDNCKEKTKFCKNSVECDTCKRIIRILEETPSLGLSEISRIMNKGVSSVAYHIEGLKHEGFLEQNDDKTYKLFPEDAIDRKILELIRLKPRSEEELRNELGVFGSRKIRQSLERLLLRRLIFETPEFRTGVVSENGIVSLDDLLESVYVLSYLGARSLNVCLKCGEKVDSTAGVSLYVREIPGDIEDISGMQFLVDSDLHPACLSEILREQYGEYQIRYDAFCDFCGLPLDAASIREILGAGRISFKQLVPHLSTKERMALGYYVYRDNLPREMNEPKILQALELLCHPKSEQWVGYVSSFSDCEKIVEKIRQGFRIGKIQSEELKFDGRYFEKRAERLWEIAWKLIREKERRVDETITLLLGPLGKISEKVNLWLATREFLKGGRYVEMRHAAGGEKAVLLEGLVSDNYCSCYVLVKGKRHHPYCAMLKKLVSTEEQD